MFVNQGIDSFVTTLRDLQSTEDDKIDIQKYEGTIYRIRIEIQSKKILIESPSMRLLDSIVTFVGGCVEREETLFVMK